MATVNLAVEQITRAGTDLTDTGSLSTGNTYTFPNDGQTFLHFKKSGAGACTVTIVTPKTIGGMAVADLTVSVPASTGDKMIGPFPPDLFNDSAGLCSFTLSEITGLTVAIARF